jgi:hypothetical protein
MEYDWLPASPVLIENLRSVFRGDRTHWSDSSIAIGVIEARRARTTDHNTDTMVPVDGTSHILDELAMAVMTRSRSRRVSSFTDPVAASGIPARQAERAARPT